MNSVKRDCKDCGAKVVLNKKPVKGATTLCEACSGKRGVVVTRLLEVFTKIDEKIGRL